MKCGSLLNVFFFLIEMLEGPRWQSSSLYDTIYIWFVYTIPTQLYIQFVLWLRVNIMSTRINFTRTIISSSMRVMDLEKSGYLSKCALRARACKAKIGNIWTVFLVILLLRWMFGMFRCIGILRDDDLFRQYFKTWS